VNAKLWEQLSSWLYTARHHSILMKVLGLSQPLHQNSIDSAASIPQSLVHVPDIEWFKSMESAVHFGSGEFVSSRWLGD
jgi:hypothetical protein